MPAQKSDNPLHAEINKYFNISVYEFNSVAIVDGKKVNTYTYEGINSANEVAAYIADEQLKIKLFNKVLDSGVDKYTTFIRKRLKIVFYSK
ncbi:hypothetical protein AMR72_16410 [Flavobacterium psychrophilum]|nr:hypothetical protein AMR72_16410 [Flavobacterium psychrophilum]AOE53947.1 hypothetical protein ALW18_16400 [Flavobacterium psychrophilum]